MRGLGVRRSLIPNYPLPHSITIHIPIPLPPSHLRPQQLISNAKDDPQHAVFVASKSFSHFARNAMPSTSITAVPYVEALLELRFIASSIIFQPCLAGLQPPPCEEDHFVIKQVLIPSTIDLCRGSTPHSSLALIFKLSLVSSSRMG